jgi:hypothetical protein
MNPIRHLREELDRLEDALQRAGAALIAAEESNADPKELKELLIAYEIKANRPVNRERWLREHGQRLRWHQGLCATSELPDETHAAGHVSRALIENTEA